MDPLSPMKGMGVETGVRIDNPSLQSVHGMDHTTTPNEDKTSQIPNENESVREENKEIGEDEPSRCDVDSMPPLIGPDTKYDENKMREAIANWILSTEQPFATVEDAMFVKMMKTATPLFEKVSRVTITSDYFKVYEHEKKRLKALTKVASKISLTTDCWKSSHQKIEYMVITAHFVDHNWRLQKYVLSFEHVHPPHTTVDIIDGIYKYLQEWEIKDKIFTISVDNIAYNDKALRRLKENFSRVRKLSCGGILFRIRCCAHILNLLVKDGLAIIEHIIRDVREGIKYMNNLEGRCLNFSKAAHQMHILDRKLMLDVPTRWYSTYDMLCMTLKFKDAFPRYVEYEPHFHHLPTHEDWENVQSVCENLKFFKVCTNIISGSDYPTANLYVIECIE
ncbi:zinc finger BED domain-containing protein RICESLEEPER 2-like [Lactuca sativa]|uniref:zinc finger BED domain-containing protein RICESLEEPER 2-like n=1 Tax=Lactuca sativa TaxID=4236 RepID=UPI000CD8D360|nr:zinc finger BED domain-containing protein RICESLEEPER 2-like [Lactuca sativa]